MWILTSTNNPFANFLGGVSGSSSPAERPFLTESQLNYYLSGFAHLSAGQAAAVGAAAGAKLATATFGISVGIGALVGFIVARTGNQTKDDRQEFAQRLGFPAGLSVASGHNTPLSGPDDTSKGLYPYLVHHGFHDSLVVPALNIIGRQDYDANAQWMLDVLVALWTVNYRFPR